MQPSQPYRCEEHEASDLKYRALQDHARIALERLDRLVVDDRGIGQQVNIWLSTHGMLLHIRQDLYCFDFIFGLHCADHGQLAKISRKKGQV